LADTVGKSAAAASSSSKGRLIRPNLTSTESAMNVTRVLASLVAVIGFVGAAGAALPIRMYDVEGVVEKVVPATEAEKKEGVLVTVFLKDRKEGVAVTKNTAVHLQMGKLVPVAEVGDIKKGSKLSVWVKDKGSVAEGVLIFP
jgi:hypothetical protein